MTGKINSTSLCPHCAAEHYGPEGDCEKEPLVSLRNVSMSWEGKKVLENVSIVIRKGDFIAITGPNGGGKTTLLRIILGLLKPVSGKVEYHDPGIRIGYLPQKNLIDSHFPISVKEVVSSGLLAIKGLSENEREKLCMDTIAKMGLKEHTQQSIGALSGGQLQRTLLGRAVICSPALLVLDEPLSYIDKQFEAHLYRLIDDLSKNTTIVLVSHEMSTIAGMANRHFIVDRTIHACSAKHHFIHSECDE